MLAPYKELLLLPRELWVLFFGILVNRLGTMVLPFFTLYLTESRGLTPKAAGAHLALYGLIAVVISPLSGLVGMRFGPVRVLCFALFAAAVVLAGLPYLPTGLALLLGVVLLSITTELYRPLVFALTAETASEAQRSSAVVLIRLGANIGMSVGPAIGGLLVVYSYTALFWVDAVTTALAGALSYYWLIVKAWAAAPLIRGAGAGGEARRWWQEVRGLLRDRHFMALWWGVLGVSILLFQHESSWPLILVGEKGFSETVYGSMFTVNTLMIIFLELPFTQYLRRFPIKHVLAIAAVAMTISICGIAWADTLPEFLFLVVVFTVAEMMAFPMSTSYVGSLSGAGQRATYMGFYVMAFSASFVIGSFVGPAVWELFGTNGLALVLALVGALSLFCFRRL